MYNYKICIPSYKRPQLIKDYTLKLLDKYYVNKDNIDIIVENEDMKKEYLESLGNDYNIIVSDTNGICEKRNFVRHYYQHETDVKYLVCIDDDIENLIDYDVPLTPIGFEKTIQTGFEECEKNNLYLWGVSPFHNVFFLSKKVSTNLKYICGALFGLIIDRTKDVIYSDLDHYEDFLFTCEHFIRDNGVVRLNWIALKTKYFNPKGGITEWYGGVRARKEAQIKNATYMKDRYGDMCRVIIKKYGYDLRLNHNYKNQML